MFQHSFLAKSPRLCIRSFQSLRRVTLPGSPFDSPGWKAYSNALKQNSPSLSPKDEIYQLNPKGDVPETTRNARLQLSHLPAEHYGHWPPPRGQRLSATSGSSSPQKITLDSVLKVEEHIPQEEVNQSIEGLRPQTPFLEDVEYRKLQQELVRAYSLSQLKNYYLQNMTTAVTEGPSPEPVECDWDLVVSDWKPRRSTLDKPLDELELSKESSEDVIIRILRQVWGITPRFELETLGELEARIQPWQEQLLFHRTTKGQLNYKVLVESAALTNLAAIFYRPKSRLMRVVANQIDASYIVKRLRSRLNQIGKQSQKTRFWNREASHVHTLKTICDQAGVVAQPSAAGETCIYGMDQSSVRVVAQKLASISWELSIPSSTMSLAAVGTLAKVQPYAVALQASGSNSFAYLQANPVSKNTPIYRLVEPNGRQSAAIDFSHTASTRLADALSTELDGRQGEKLSRRSKNSTPTKARRQWSGEICTLYNGSSASDGRAPTASHQLPYIQSLLSYFTADHRRTQEVTLHFMGKSSRSQRHLLDAKWLADQSAVGSTDFSGVIEPVKKERVLLAMPAGAVDLSLTRTTYIPVHPSLHTWVQGISFRNRPGKKSGELELEVVDKADDPMPLDEIQVTHPQGARSTCTPWMYTRQYTEIVQIVSLSPRIDVLSEGVEGRVKDLLLKEWPDGVELQLRQSQGDARRLHITSTKKGEDGLHPAQVAVFKAGLIIVQLLTWAGEGKLKMYASRE